MDKFLQKKRNVVLIAIFYCFLWGSAFPLVKICMEQTGAADNMSKCLVAGFRFTLSGAILSGYCLIKGKNKEENTRKNVGTVIVYGVLTALQYSFTYIGLSRVNGSVGAIFDQLCVFIVIIFGGIFLKNDSLTVKKIAGCVIGLAGILAVSTEGLAFKFELMGEGMMTLAALTQAFAYFVAVFSAKTLSAFKLVGFGQLTAGMMLTVYSLAMGGSVDRINLAGGVTLLALALISAIAYVLSLLPLKYFPASEIAVFNLLITVFGVVMSALVLGENVFKFNYLVSLLLVSAGIFLVNHNGSKNK